jgi:hypothetical protein
LRFAEAKHFGIRTYFSLAASLYVSGLGDSGRSIRPLPDAVLVESSPA